MLALVLAVAAFAGPGEDARAFAASVARQGARPAAGVAERRAHVRVRRRFVRAGLDVRVQRFSTPRGRSRNMIGVRRGRRRCVRVLMAHADTVPPSPGAEDNASGLGLLAGLAGRLDKVDPPCTVWLVATGAEERIYTGSPDHLGALALRRIVPRRRLRYALSLDEVGRGSYFRLRSPVDGPRRGVERELLAAAERVDVRLDYEQDGIRLVVQDHGPGAPVAVGPGSEGGGYGLTGMRERAELLGGRLSASPTDDGFRVELWLPER